MSDTFVAKPLKNVSIVTAILLRVDTTKNMLTTHYNIYVYIYMYILHCSKEGRQLVLYVHSSQLMGS